MQKISTSVLASSIEKGKAISVELTGKKIAIFNVDGKFYALNDTCGHRGAPLSEGSLDGNAVACPWHGFVFDVTTGYCATVSNIQQTTYPVTVVNDVLWIELPTQTS